MTIILASQSRARREMLAAAGLEFIVRAAEVDEGETKARLRGAEEIALALAEEKALHVAVAMPAAHVIGSDQMLETDDGAFLNKPLNMNDLRDQLRALSGRTHRLFSAVAIVRCNAVIWSHVDVARLAMRDLSDGFIDDYIAAEGDDLRHCVGGYRIEGRGIQLFSRVEGSHFTILGLPLLPLLDQLRSLGEMTS
jgi:septum formation protein